jgi:hypothetical protein
VSPHAPHHILELLLREPDALGRARARVVSQDQRARIVNDRPKGGLMHGRYFESGDSTEF